MPYKELTKKYLEDLKAKIAERIPKNTGDASSSLEIDGNKLLGNDYIYYLDQGRGPGRFPPVDKMREWVNSKLGLTGKEGDSVAFLIGRKLKNEGSEIFKDKSKGIQLDSLADDMMNDLLKELPDTAAVEALKWL
jgi:hypothetical protein